MINKMRNIINNIIFGYNLIDDKKQFIGVCLLISIIIIFSSLFVNCFNQCETDAKINNII